MKSIRFITVGIALLFILLHPVSVNAGNEDEETPKASGKAAGLKSDFAESWFHRGIALGRQGKHVDALQAFDEAVGLKPGYAEAWYYRGVALGKIGKHDDALKSHDRALVMKPGYASAWNNEPLPGLKPRVSGLLA